MSWSKHGQEKKSGTKDQNKESSPPKTVKRFSCSPAKFRSWSNEAMLQAIETVKSGKLGVNRAALEHNVLRTTLKDRISGRVVHGTNMGPKPYLTYEEEKELVDFLLMCSRIGYGKTRSEVLRIIEAIMKRKGRKHEWSCFCER